MKFSELNIGDVFSYSNVLWVKIRPITILEVVPCDVNAAAASRDGAGELLRLGDDDEVERIDIDNLIQLKAALCRKWYRMDTMEASDDHD